MENKINIVELFGGIGSPNEALKRLGIDYEVVDYVEINKQAVYSYNRLNNKDYSQNSVVGYRLKKITKILYHGSPCTDFSFQGKGAGGGEGEERVEESSACGKNKRHQSPKMEGVCSPPEG